MGDALGAEPHTYVIEKASRARAEVSGDGDQFKNGVHVSHWVDVAPNVEHDALHTLKGSDVMNNTGKPFCMRTLRELAVDLGEYEVSSCNCHHAAFIVYNACARESARVPRIPNYMLVYGAYLLRCAGLDIANSRSAASNSI